MESHLIWTANSPTAKSCEQLTKCGCNLAAVAGENATGLVSPAQPCEVANVKCSFSVLSDHLIEIMLYFNPGCSGEFRYNFGAVFY